MVTAGVRGLGIRLVIAGIGGTLLGAGGALWLQPKAELPERAVPCVEVAADLQRELDDLDARRQALGREIRTLRQERARVVGLMRPWPEAPADPLRPDAVRSHLDAVLAESEAELRELDCKAYPCVAVLSWPVPDEELELVDDGQGGALLSGALAATLRQGDYAGLTLLDAGAIVDDAGRETVHAVAWVGPEDIRASKQMSAEELERTGSLLDQAGARAEAVLDRFLDEGASP